jgi:hypothetical protein
MKNDQLARRVRALEAEVEALQKMFANTARNGKKKGDLNSWKATAGMFANDPWFEEVVRLGREYRESLRPGKKKTNGKKPMGKPVRRVGS